MAQLEAALDDAIRGVEFGKYRFYVERPARHRVWVVVAVSASSRNYLKTETDGEPSETSSAPRAPSPCDRR